MSSRGRNNESFSLGDVNSHDSSEDQLIVVLHIDWKPMQFKINT